MSSRKVAQLVSSLQVFQLKLCVNFWSPHSYYMPAHPILVYLITLIVSYLMSTNYEALSSFLRHPYLYKRLEGKKWPSSGMLRYVSLIVLMMETVSTSERSVNFYHTTRRNIPEDSHLHTHRRESPKSHLKEEKIRNWTWASIPRIKFVFNFLVNVILICYNCIKISEHSHIDNLDLWFWTFLN
jgi:uncharacterized membrane protein YraQ (UPF0718 family)